MSRILSIPEDYESHCDIVSILVCSKKKKRKLGTSLMCVIICVNFVEVLCSGIEKEWHKCLQARV